MTDQAPVSAITIGARDVSLDYVHSEKLTEVESGISDTIKGVVLSKKAVCVALANIKLKKLYRQAGIASFKDYIKAQRISIPYHTAHDHARIGEAFLKHRERLEGIDFKEEDGLKKLLLLENALQEHEEDKERVFTKLKQDSLRQFARFTRGGCQSARADSQSAAPDKGSWSALEKLEEREECIVLMPLEKEILWFDPDLENFLPSRGLVSQFRKHILKAACEFLHSLQVKYNMSFQ